MGWSTGSSKSRGHCQGVFERDVLKSWKCFWGNTSEGRQRRKAGLSSFADLYPFSQQVRPLPAELAPKLGERPIPTTRPTRLLLGQAHLFDCHSSSHFKHPLHLWVMNFWGGDLSLPSDLKFHKSSDWAVLSTIKFGMNWMNEHVTMTVSRIMRGAQYRAGDNKWQVNEQVYEWKRNSAWRLE